MRYLTIYLFLASVQGFSQALVVGSISAAQFVCATCLPARLTSTPPNGTAPTYQWQSAPSYAGTYSDIDGATSATYQPTTLTSTVFYKQLQNSSGTTGGPLPTNGVSLFVAQMELVSNIENYVEFDFRCLNAPGTMTINNYEMADPANITAVAGQKIIITNSKTMLGGYFHAYIRSLIKSVDGVAHTAISKVNGTPKVSIKKVNGVHNY